MMATNTDMLRSPEVKPAMQSSPSSSTQPSDPNYTEVEKSTKAKRVYRFFAYTESDSETEDDDEGDQSSSNDFPFWPRSKSLSFVYDECIAAIQGKAVPASIDSAMTRHSIVRGIRCHQEFANSPDMVELCSRTKSDYPELTRARNARLIMSNVIPD